MNAASHLPSWATLVGLGRRGAAFELGLYRSLYRWVFRRPVGPEGSAPFAYIGIVQAPLWAFIGLSAVEMPILHLVLPWRSAQIASLALGFWGLAWMVGLLASLHVYPHLIADSGLRIRYGSAIDIDVPWEAVAAIRHRRRDCPGSRTVHLDQEEAGTVAQIAMSGQTNIDLVLRRPLTVPLKGGRETVTELRFFADDPRTLVAHARPAVTP